MRAVLGGEATADPVLEAVPLCWPGHGRLRLDATLLDGDLVLLVFGDRSTAHLRQALQTEDVAELEPLGPTHARSHALSDALAIPIASYGAAATVDLLDWLRDFAALIQTATTGLGDATLAPALQAEVALMVAQLDAVR